MAEEQPIYDTSQDTAADYIKAKEMDLEAGLLGKIFGADNRAASNIAGTVIILLVISGICVSFWGSNVPTIDYWKVITPIITLTLGYLFGKHKQ